MVPQSPHWPQTGLWSALTMRHLNEEGAAIASLCDVNAVHHGDVLWVPGYGKTMNGTPMV